MKHILTVLAALFAWPCFAQSDHNGNPVINSIPMGEDSIGGCKLLANYYTLQNNIDNKTTSVYISDKPGIEEVAMAATNLPSDFFILVRNDQVIKLILINNYPKKWILVSTPDEAEPKKYKNPLKGDISENRANELIKAGYDPSATISDGKLNFSGKHYTITTNQEIKATVIDLIKQQRFDTAGSSGATLPSKDELHNMILMQTREGGKLDFFTPIKGHEMEGIQVKPGIFDTRIGLALYKWGKACYDLGVVDVDEANAIFSEFKGRPLNMREKAYIKLGFEKGLEK
jgi:hypothetical protein